MRTLSDAPGGQHAGIVTPLNTDTMHPVQRQSKPVERKKSKHQVQTAKGLTLLKATVAAKAESTNRPCEHTGYLSVQDKKRTSSRVEALVLIAQAIAPRNAPSHIALRNAVRHVVKSMVDMLAQR
ncbi:hypothetical protein BWQ96_03766 [Gracilariopsis chorda]|uniref:Uncharacterized protein n=1 Tax=Gracilariopsis chorda TaxID=448386 RepID=A0A2V3IWF7_9FLOR|nr:hypothetical protein BWQ96_03766 [Gracilariopsis chorda]|eukprot:PXF46441.1 hypothetical protein BWQ96_03766 [Gracilariopsis chorda]